jgi:hypothetical protein
MKSARAETALGQKDKARESAQETLPHLQRNLDPSSALIAGARELTVI